MNTTTLYVSKYLDPLAKETEFYIQDSFNFIICLEQNCLHPDCLIVICDAVNLYRPSIVLSDGLNLLKRFFLTKTIPTNKINLIVDLWKWVLTNNYIQFGNTTWLQTKGTAIGKPIITVTYDISTTNGVFLDIEIFVSNSLLTENTLDTKIYQKPNNQYSMLHR